MSQFPTWEVGDLVTADALNSMLPNTYTKSSALSRNTTITVAADSELQGIPLAVGTYEIELLVIFNAANATPGLRTSWVFTGTWNDPFRLCLGPATSNASSPDVATPINVRCYQAGSATSGYDSNGSTFAMVRETSAQVVVTVAGSLSFSWAQQVSDAGNTTVQTGTSFVIRRTA